MRICLVGKFPPIQGGVSMRTYWSAHALALRGHDVHVVTNAKEAAPPFRMHMRSADWARCEATYGPGSVTVHWTDPVDPSQSYIPMASPFISKLATVAARAHSEHPFDVVFSFYMEPYAIAGHLAAEMTGVPHVVRMAGSDAGRLWHHSQFEALYDHVLRSAALVIAGGVVAERAIRRGVDPDRIALGGGFVVPEDLFTPDGPTLDLSALRAEVAAEPTLRDLLWGDLPPDRPYFGVYGKLGESKGSFALLAALDRLKRAGLEVGLIALAHGQAEVQKRFRARARKLDLADRILQIPFLPHWRVPEFLRGCVAACCLEQDFPIVFHTPIIACEVLLSGTCLVASTELIRKLPGHERLPHGYGCVAIEDVNDVDVLSEKLAAIVKDPEPIAAVATRGRAFARELQGDLTFFPQRLERILEAAAGRQQAPSSEGRATDIATAQLSDDRFPLTQLALAEIQKADRHENDASLSSDRAIDLERAHEVLAAVEGLVAVGETHLRRLILAIRLEIAIASAEREATSRGGPDPLFRLLVPRWAMGDGDLAGLVPLRDPRLRIVEFDYDVAEFRSAQTLAELPEVPTPARSYIVVFGQCQKAPRQPLLVDSLTARILKLSDGRRTVSEIVTELDSHAGSPTAADNMKWIEGLFVHRLLSLQNERLPPTEDG